MVLAHAGIGAGTLSEVLGAWTWEPTALITVAVAVVLYTVGMARSAGRSRLFPLWRRLSFYSGVSIVFLALISPIDALTDHLFFMHMVQHMMLTMAAAPLIMLGIPIVPMMRGLPRSFRRGVVGPIARNRAVRRVFSWLLMGRVAFVAFFGAMWLWHIPFFYNLALTNELVHIVEHATFMLTAVLYWGAVIDQVPFRARMSHGARILYLLGSGTPSGTLGAFLTYSPSVWYSFYEQGSTRLWGFTAILDQNMSGLIMWGHSWMMFIGAAAVVFFIMMSEDERETRAREAEYNARAASSTP